MGGRASTQAEEELRYAWVDVAKGICIVLVVMMHSTLGTGEALGGEGFLHPVLDSKSTDTLTTLTQALPASPGEWKPWRLAK